MMEFLPQETPVLLLVKMDTSLEAVPIEHVRMIDPGVELRLYAEV